MYPAISGTENRVAARPWVQDLRYLSILALFPLMLALLDDNWAFTSSQSGFIDPWLYVSYFLHLKAQLLAFPSAYYGDRLSYIVPGWLIYHVFGPFLGNYVLKLGDIYIALGALYFLVKIIFDRRTALLCCALISVHPFFLMAFGWDYTNGAGIGYYTLSLLCCVWAAKSPSYKLALFLGGLLWISLITTQLLWLNLAWTIPLGYLLANRTGSKHPLFKSLGMFSLGCVVAFGAYCGMNYILMGQWFFLANSMRHTLNGFGAAQQVNAPIGTWIESGSWLIHYSCLLPVAVVLWWRRRHDGRAVVSFALFVTSYLTIWAWQYAGFPFVMINFYTSYMFPVYALALAAVVTDGVAVLSDRAYGCLVFLALAAGSALVFCHPLCDQIRPTVMKVIESHPWSTWLWSYRSPAVAVVCLIGFVPLCLGSTWRRLSLPVLTGTLLFIFASQLFMYSAYRHGWFAARSEFTNKEGFRMVLEADAWTDKLKPDRRLLVWYDQTDRETGLLRGVTSLYEWGWSMLNLELPTLKPEDFPKLANQPNVLVLSSRPEQLVSARAVLASRGLTSWKQITLRAGTTPLHLGFAKIADVLPDIEAIPGVLRLTDIVSATREASLKIGGVVDLITAPAQWSYAASVAIPAPGVEGRMYIRLSVKVKHGQAAIGVLNGPKTDFYSRKMIDASDRFQDVLLEVDHPGESRDLIIANSTPEGKAAEVLIDRIEVMAKRDTPMWQRLRALEPAGAR